MNVRLPSEESGGTSGGGYWRPDVVAQQQLVSTREALAKERQAEYNDYLAKQQLMSPMRTVVVATAVASSTTASTNNIAAATTGRVSEVPIRFRQQDDGANDDIRARAEERKKQYAMELQLQIDAKKQKERAEKAAVRLEAQMIAGLRMEAYEAALKKMHATTPTDFGAFHERQLPPRDIVQPRVTIMHDNHEQQQNFAPSQPQMPTVSYSSFPEAVREPVHVRSACAAEQPQARRVARGPSSSTTKQEEFTMRRNVEYKHALEAQIREKSERKQREKLEKLASERQDCKIAESYNPWGQSGGGAPVRDTGGNVVTDIRRFNQEAQERITSRDAATAAALEQHKRQQLFEQQQQKQLINHNLNHKAQNAITVSPGHPFVSKQPHILPNEMIDSKFKAREELQAALAVQIEEKKRIKEAEKARDRAEAAAEEKRLKDEQAILNAAYEKEKATERAKAEERLKTEEAAFQLAMDKRRPAQERRQLSSARAQLSTTNADYTSTTATSSSSQSMKFSLPISEYNEEKAHILEDLSEHTNNDSIAQFQRREETGDESNAEARLKNEDVKGNEYIELPARSTFLVNGETYPNNIGQHEDLDLSLSADSFFLYPGESGIDRMQEQYPAIQIASKFVENKFNNTEHSTLIQKRNVTRQKAMEFAELLKNDLSVDQLDELLKSLLDAANGRKNEDGDIISTPDSAKSISGDSHFKKI